MIVGLRCNYREARVDSEYYHHVESKILVNSLLSRSSGRCPHAAEVPGSPDLLYSWEKEGERANGRDEKDIRGDPCQHFVDILPEVADRGGTRWEAELREEEEEEGHHEASYLAVDIEGAGEVHGWEDDETESVRCGRSLWVVEHVHKRVVEAELGQELA